MAELKPRLIQFTWNGQEITFRVMSNINESQSRIAFEAWIMKTNEITVDSFCAYVCSINPLFECNKV